MVKVKFGLLIWGGLVCGVVWLFFFKVFMLKDWVIFLESYG